MYLFHVFLHTGRGRVLRVELKLFLSMDQPPPKRLRLGTDVSEPGQASAAHGTVSSDGGHLRENDVGISEYINAHPGFFAVLKQRSSSWCLLANSTLFRNCSTLLLFQRYSDFMVHEISTNGQTVQLTTYELPKAAEREVGGVSV